MARYELSKRTRRNQNTEPWPGARRLPRAHPRDSGLRLRHSSPWGSPIRRPGTISQGLPVACETLPMTTPGHPCGGLRPQQPIHQPAGAVRKAAKIRSRLKWLSNLATTHSTASSITRKGSTIASRSKGVFQPGLQQNRSGITTSLGRKSSHALRQHPRFERARNGDAGSILTPLNRKVREGMGQRSIKTNPEKSAPQGREPSSNKIAHRRSCIFRISSWHSCPSAAGCRRGR